MDKIKELKLMTLLEDIAESLRVISGRSEPVNIKKRSYADSYFTKSSSTSEK